MEGGANTSNTQKRKEQNIMFYFSLNTKKLNCGPVRDQSWHVDDLRRPLPCISRPQARLMTRFDISVSI